MKNKKLLAIILALAMILAFSTSAFANEQTLGNATIKIVILEEDCGTYPVSVDGISSLYDIIMDNFGSDDALYGDWYPVWDEIYYDFYWPTMPVKYLTSFCLQDSIIVDYYNIDNIWYCNSYDWVYTVNNVKPVWSYDETPVGYEYQENHEKTMDQYIVQDGDVIVLNYDFWSEVYE